MQQALETLLALQEIDSQSDQHRETVDHLRKAPEIQELEEKAAELDALADQFQEDLSGLERRRRRKELELHSIENEKESLESRMYSGNQDSSKELVNLQKKVKNLQDQQSDQELDILQIMEDMDDVEDDLENVRSQLQQLQKKIEQQRKKNETSIKKYQKTLRQLRSKRKKAAERVDSDLLQRYQHKRKQRQVVIAPVDDDEICGHCRVSLPMLQLKRVKAGKEIVICDRCQRMLVWQGEQS